jgi:Cu+-exporting ATPase
MEATAEQVITAIGAGRTEERPACFHCGTACVAGRHSDGHREFCCAGCQTVFELLSEAGLDRYYELGDGVRARIDASTGEEKFRFLDTPEVRMRFVDHEDATTTRVTFHLPEIHCLACVWLLENLFRLKAGIGKSTVHFPRKQAVITFDPGVVKLSEVAALLDSVGYPPELKLADLDRKKVDPVMRRLWLQVGVAGFAFGNTMLFSIAIYLGLDAFSEPTLVRLFGWLSVMLSLPVILISAQDYWKASWRALKLRQIPIEVPIAAGIVAIWMQSVWEVVAGRGEGYFDSLAGLLFFLNIGRIFQQKTFDRLAFDRDYRSFFPLSVVREREGKGKEERIALAQVGVGDRLTVRNGELIPADSRLVSGAAEIDYSFVTGEAEPVRRGIGDKLHAGGRQTGGMIVVETVKAVNQGYLTDLWNQETFRKEKDNTFGTLTNRYSRRFTWIILGVATASALFWMPMDGARGLKAFVSVLIVACPCALALAAPFALGSAQRILARRHIFLRNPEVIETLAQVDTVVFDKTGTLTSAVAGEVGWHGEPLMAGDRAMIRDLARQSAHPLSQRVASSLASEAAEGVAVVSGFREVPGSGVEGMSDGICWRLGSAAWLREQGMEVPELGVGGSRVAVAKGGKHLGQFVVGGQVRTEMDGLLRGLAGSHELALLSGDNEREKERFTVLFGGGNRLHFNQSPLDKLGFIRGLQAQGRRVLMAGDGLNDAGALRQAEVGVAVVEETSAFSPASDVILRADQVVQLGSVLDFSRRVVGVVRVSFLISTAYNVVGLAIAASGKLSPVVCAVLMPLSSVTVVLAACGLAEWAGWKAGVSGKGSPRTVEGVATEAKHP